MYGIRFLKVLFATESVNILDFFLHKVNINRY